MPQPSPGDVHVDAILTNISVAYAQRADAFIADQVFPRVPVKKQSDKYYTYPKGYWFRSEAEKRAPGTESAGSGWALSTDNYFAEPWAVHKDNDDQTVANYDSPLDANADATRWVTDQMLLKRDLEWQAAFFIAGVWGTNYTGVASSPSTNEFLQFDQAGSTPIDFIKGQIVAIGQATGMRPNTLVMGPEVEVILTEHSTIIERIKYSERGIVSRALLATLFGVDRVLVPTAIQNTAAEGATDAMSYVYGKDMLLVYTAPAPSLRSPSGGYTFTWTGLYGAGAFGGRIKNFRLESLASDRIEGEAAWDMKVTAADVGLFMADAVG
jgi:hypothetical protein